MEKIYGYYLDELESNGNIYGYDLYKIIRTKNYNIKYSKVKYVPVKEYDLYAEYKGRKVFKNENEFIDDITINYKVNLK